MPVKSPQSLDIHSRLVKRACILFIDLAAAHADASGVAEKGPLPTWVVGRLGITADASRLRWERGRMPGSYNACNALCARLDGMRYVGGPRS